MYISASFKSLCCNEGDSKYTNNCSPILWPDKEELLTHIAYSIVRNEHKVIARLRFLAAISAGLDIVPHFIVYIFIYSNEQRSLFNIIYIPTEHYSYEI